MGYVMTQEEKDFLKQYDISKFKQPSVTVDIAVFAIRAEDDEEERDYRRDPVLSLSLLMVRRGMYPYKDRWALPGGFLHQGESIAECAGRELKEETSVEDAYLHPFGTFSQDGRDPRGWIISVGFLALMDARKYRIRAGSDAWDAAWFTMTAHREKETRKEKGQDVTITCVWRLMLENRHEGVRLTGWVEETKRFSGHRRMVSYRLLESEGFAFDHAKIVLQAFVELRNRTQQDGKIVFDLMPEKFTLNMLQEAHEIILGRSLLTPNFRRKIEPYVTQTEETYTGVGHRPARLYVRNLEAFYTDE